MWVAGAVEKLRMRIFLEVAGMDPEQIKEARLSGIVALSNGVDV